MWVNLLAMVFALALLPCGVAAHQRGVSYSDISVEAGRVRYDLRIAGHDLPALDADGNRSIDEDEILAQYAALRGELESDLRVEVGGVRCTLRLADFIFDEEGAVIFRLRGTCPEGEPLRVGFDTLAGTGSERYNLAKIRYGGTIVEYVFTSRDSEVVLEGSTAVLTTMRRFLLLGFEHIATGYDHLIFLLALLLIGGGMATLVGIVTAFTIAHSLTLALATFGVITLPERLVESAIALSIAWVALENVVFDRSHGRWRITFAFGLVHGLGFASILTAMHLPARDLALSLLAFNVGVEVGQVGVVVVTYPLIAALQRARRRRLIVAGASWGVLALALYWFVERTFS